MTRKQLQDERFKLIMDLEIKLARRVENAQRELYSKILEVIGELNTDEGKITFTAANITKQNRVREVVEEFHRGRLSRVVMWMVNRIRDLVSINRRYFSTMAEEVGNISDRILSSFGYANGRLRRGSRLFNLLNDNSTLTRISTIISNGINGNQTLTRLRQSLRNLVIRDDRLGDVQRRFFQNAGDIFAEADRTIQLQYANDLGFNFLIWAHTIIDTSTEFCRERSNRLYSRDFAERWDIELEWKGKKEGNNVFVDGHGYGCRSTVNWISDPLARNFERRIGLNQFN